MITTAEHQRLADSQNRTADWKNWGPYVSERAWGTVREDYSSDGNAWQAFPHDFARSRAYRWNEDGLAGVCNRFQNICLAIALWNEHDSILKERLFGLSGDEGNHGEDVKEYYFYLDNTPTHSYMKMLYKYPQVAFPYHDLVETNRQRGRFDPEFELIDALPQAFQDNRYFDVFIEYAKADEEDLLCRVTAVNQGPDAAPIHILPHLWYRNVWSWGYNSERPVIRATGPGEAETQHRHLGRRWWYVRADGQTPELLFTENDTNHNRLYGQDNTTPYVKDGIHETVVNGQRGGVNPEQIGSKAAAHFQKLVAPGETFVVQIRFSNKQQHQPFDQLDAIFNQRIQEADAFYATVHPAHLSPDEKLIQRQALAGLLWSKQFYHYSVELWLKGDPVGTPTPPQHQDGRNHDWGHLYNLDVLSMPDKWEYPWYAAWDTAFQSLPIAMVDPEWAKRQLILLLREWYMHPNGQIPAYEWNFSDVNPPVHAWAAWRVYKITRNITGKADTIFLERVFQKLLLNFTWWVNRVDPEGNNIFQGGFLGLDNISVFNRSAALPTGGFMQQADGTAWMGMYSLNMLAIALELARTHPAYEDVATKFFEHFIYIANAMHNLGGDNYSLWDEQDGLFYDVLRQNDGSYMPIKTRSIVGLIPLFAVETLETDMLEKLPRFRQRMEWFMRYRPHLVEHIPSLTEQGEGGRLLLSILNRTQLERILQRMLDPEEFLSDYGLRSVSKYHAAHPYEWRINDQTYRLDYEPAEATTGLFGGNSNWRGPIWFPLNYLMVESLQKYHHYYGDILKVEMPTGSAQFATLDQTATQLAQRLNMIFVQQDGKRAVFGNRSYFDSQPEWRDYIPFYEYFHGDTGAGLGASHQTGWTALIARLIQYHAAKNTEARYS